MESMRPLCPRVLAEGMAHLRNVDSQLARVMDAYPGGYERLTTPSTTSCFAALARAIVGQQLAGAAARTIYARFEAACGGEDQVQPTRVLQLSEDDLRASGLSGAKARYVVDLASHFADGRLSDGYLNGCNDEEMLTKSLLAVKGIGRWTVDMFLMFHLRRPDVLPVGDLVVRKGFAKLYGLAGKKGGSLPADGQMVQVADKWRPFRSLGSFLMWRVFDVDLPVAPVPPASPSPPLGRVVSAEQISVATPVKRPRAAVQTPRTSGRKRPRRAEPAVVHMHTPVGRDEAH